MKSFVHGIVVGFAANFDLIKITDTQTPTFIFNVIRRRRFALFLENFFFFPPNNDNRLPHTVDVPRARSHTTDNDSDGDEDAKTEKNMYISD